MSERMTPEESVTLTTSAPADNESSAEVGKAPKCFRKLEEECVGPVLLPVTTATAVVRWSAAVGFYADPKTRT